MTKRTPPKRVDGIEFPKIRIKRTFAEQGAEAAEALGRELKISDAKLRRWLKAFGQGKGIKAPKPDKKAPAPVTKSTSPFLEHATREAAERHRDAISKRSGTSIKAYIIAENGDRFIVAPAHEAKGHAPQFEVGDWVMDTIIPNSLGRIVAAGPQCCEVRYEVRRNGIADRDVTIPNHYLYKVETPPQTKMSKRS